MFCTRTINIKQKYPIAEYLCQVTHNFKNMRNAANFYIRNTITGIQKSPEERPANEIEILHEVFTGLTLANNAAEKRLQRKCDEARLLAGMHGESIMKNAINHISFFKYPDRNNWMLSYEQLDAIFKCTKNAIYYSLPAQVNQQALRRTIKDWKSYFKACAAKKQNPSAFRGPVRLPGYIRSSNTTTHFTSQVSKPRLSGKGLTVSLPGSGLLLYCGKGILPQDVVKIEVRPEYRGYCVLITYDWHGEEPSVPKYPHRVLGLDSGVSNFLTGVFSFSHAPFIADGAWLKSVNQWYNKERARLVSEITGGQSKYFLTGRLSALSADRNRKFRDYFYKLAHYICRICHTEQVKVIVFGHNKGQKQEITMGDANNQNFVQIPFMKFYQILQTVACQYGIPVITSEESYTSQADFLSGDHIPTYGKENGTRPVFSGRREKRGQYRSANGIVLNADVNAAANIIRKEYPDAFADITDFSFLWKSVDVVTRESLVCRAQKKHNGRISRKKPLVSAARKIRHCTHWKRKIKLMQVFDVGKKSRNFYIQSVNQAG